MTRITLTTTAANSNAEERRLFMDEINVMKKVSNGNNPHILKMLGCVTATHPMMLVLQFVPHGNLKNYLKTIKATAVRTLLNVALPLFSIQSLMPIHYKVYSVGTHTHARARAHVQRTHTQAYKL